MLRLLFGLALFLLLLTVKAPAQSPSRNGVAERAAAVFCAQLRLAPGTAHTVGPPRSIDRYMLPCREVKVTRIQGRAYAFEIVDSTGEIAYFSNDGLYDDLDRDSRPAGPAIPRETAINIAKSVLGESGLREAIADPAAIEQQYTRPPRASAHVWRVSFRRVTGGVPFRTEDVVVMLDAETGALKGMSKNFLSLPPKSRKALVSAQTAARVAAPLAGDAGIRSAPRLPTLKYVQPNPFWTTRQMDVETHLPAELAWIVVYPGENNTDTTEVWVSAVTGQVVGGDSVFLMHRKSPEKSPARRGRPWIRDADQFNKLIGAAREFRVYSQAGATKPAGLLDDRHNAALFSSLRSMRISKHPDGIKMAVRCRLVIRTVDGEYELGFAPRSEIVLATVTDYGSMPPSILAWLKTLNLGGGPHRHAAPSKKSVTNTSHVKQKQ